MCSSLLTRKIAGYSHIVGGENSILLNVKALTMFDLAAVGYLKLKVNILNVLYSKIKLYVIAINIKPEIDPCCCPVYFANPQKKGFLHISQTGSIRGQCSALF